MVVVDEASVAKMSGGDVDVKPSLSCRNALGNENRNSNSQRRNRVKIFGVVAVSDGGCEKQWWYAKV